MSKDLFKEINDINKLTQKGKIEVAYNRIKKLYELNPDNNYVKFEYAKLLLKKGIKNIKEVRSIFLSLINTECHNDVLFELCCLELNFGKAKDSKKYIDLLMKTEKKDYAILEQGRLYAYNDDNMKARDAFDRLTMTGSDVHLRIIASVEVARTYIYENDYIKAKCILDNLLEQVTRDDNKSILLDLGKVEALLGNYNEATEYYNMLITTSNKCYALLALGEMAFERRQFEVARFYFEELKNNVLAYDHLGNIEMQLGNFDKAKYLYDKELGKRNGRLSKIGLLKLAIATHDYNKALEYLCQIDRGNIIDSDLEKYRLFLIHKLGDDIDSNNYFNNQVSNYSEERTIKQIKKNKSIDDKHFNYNFLDGVDIDKLFTNIKSNIPNLTKIRDGLFDRYIYKADDVVSNMYDKDTNLVDIRTFADTTDIVSIKPVVSAVTKYPRKIKKMSIID